MTPPHPCVPPGLRTLSILSHMDKKKNHTHTHTYTRTEAYILNILRPVNKRAGQMHHPRQTDRFWGLGMFTRSCRPLRPHPEPTRTQTETRETLRDNVHHVMNCNWYRFWLDCKDVLVIEKGKKKKKCFLFKHICGHELIREHQRCCYIGHLVHIQWLKADQTAVYSHSGAFVWDRFQSKIGHPDGFDRFSSRLCVAKRGPVYLTNSFVWLIHSNWKQ